MIDEILIRNSEFFKAVRTFNKMTQEDIASITGISVNVIRKIERGKSGVKLKYINAICKHCRVPEWLHEDRDNIVTEALLRACRIKSVNYSWYY